MKAAVEHIFNGLTVPTTSYDSSKTTLSRLMTQVSSPYVYAGPVPIGIARPNEASTAIPAGYPIVITKDSTYDYVFLADTATAAATRRVVLYLFNKTTGQYSWQGFLTVSFPFSGTQGTYTVRGFGVTQDLYTTGTASTSGSSTTLTGSGTAWQASRIAVGARIGFGSTDPNQITTWYDISAIGSDTSITLGSAATVAGGTSYVIQEQRIYWGLTNGTTATNGGLFVCKGIHPGLFLAAGTSISAAVSTDNVRATYKLSDASTTTMTTAAGFDFDERASWTDHDLYFLNGGGTTSARIFKFNVRAALTVATGQSTNAYTLQTGSQTVTGNIAQINNVIVYTAGHGAGNGEKSIYFVAPSRVYRVAVANVISTSTNFVSDQMVENPVGTTNTMTVGATIGTIDFDEDADNFIIVSSNIREYATKYYTNGSTFDVVFGSLAGMQYSTLADADLPYIAQHGTTASIYILNGFLHYALSGSASANSYIWSLPLSADYRYASTVNERVILPKFTLTGAVKLYNVYAIPHVMDSASEKYGLQIEPYYIQYRTTGISDNSGSWTDVPRGQDLSALGAPSEIQFSILFKVLGGTCYTSRIRGLCLTYEDGTTDSHYNPSLAKSSIASRIFAWKQVVAFGSNIPDLRIRLYNADTSALVLDDTVNANTAGTWEYSTDGTTWNAWSASADTVGNYIRYTADSLPSNITVKALLTQ